MPRPSFKLNSRARVKQLILNDYPVNVNNTRTHGVNSNRHRFYRPQQANHPNHTNHSSEFPLYVKEKTILSVHIKRIFKTEHHVVRSHNINPGPSAREQLIRQDIVP